MAAITATGIGVHPTNPFQANAFAADASPVDELKIIAPFHGAVLNGRHGQKVDGGLKIAVQGTASPGVAVTVNGVAARRDGSKFFADIVLRKKETEIVAKADASGSGRESRVRVVWDRNSYPRYRFTIDDNGFFFRDIVQKGYTSLFDCFYLAMLRDLNKRYGAKFSLNIFYALADGFTLKSFPDRYRSEWRDNASWLKLAFHADKEDPPEPYFNATPERLGHDFDMVAEQIRRFAGEDTYAPATVIHFGQVRPDAYKTLAARGVRALSGYFSKNGDHWWVNYRMDDRRSQFLSNHDALMDFDSGITFSRIDIVCNSVPLAQIVPTLEKVVANPDTAEILDLLTHEQYFWPFYHNYLPDHAKRIEAAIRFATERGYKPVFLHDGFLGVPEA
jgi:hypothetical protein